MKKMLALIPCLLLFFSCQKEKCSADMSEYKSIKDSLELCQEDMRLGHPYHLQERFEAIAAKLPRDNSDTVALRIRIQYHTILSNYYRYYNYHADSMMRHNDIVVGLSEELGDTDQLIRAYSSKANACHQMADYVESSNYYHKAMELDTERKHPELLVGMTSTYIYLYNYDMAKQFLDLSESKFEALHPLFQFEHFINNSNYYKWQWRNEESLLVLKKAKQWCNEHSDLQYPAAICDAQLAEVYQNLGLADSSALYLGRAIEYFEQNHITAMLPMMRTIQVRLALDRGDIAEAQTLVNQYPFPKGFDMPYVYSQWQEMNCRLEQAKGNWKEAYDIKQHVRQLSDSIYSSRVHARIAEQQLMFDFQLANSEQEARMQRERARFSIMLLGIIVILLVLIIAIFYQRNKMSQARMRNFQHIMYLRMENIRNRVTPHFIGNALSNVIYQARNGETPNLQGLISLIHEGQLHASELETTLEDELRFIDQYVATECTLWEDTLSYTKNFEQGIDPCNVKLPSMMLQIFVENAIKHGLRSVEGKKLLTINVSNAQNGIMLEVINNGSPNQNCPCKDSTHMGLNVLKQTITLLNQNNKQKMSYRSYIDDQGLYHATVYLPSNYTIKLYDYTSYSG